MNKLIYWTVLFIGGFALGVLTTYVGGGIILSGAAGGAWGVLVTLVLSDLRM